MDISSFLVEVEMALFFFVFIRSVKLLKTAFSPSVRLREVLISDISPLSEYYLGLRVSNRCIAGFSHFKNGLEIERIFSEGSQSLFTFFRDS